MRIDFGGPHFDPRTALHEHDDRVAIGDTHDAVFVYRAGVGLDHIEPGDRRQVERQSARPPFPSIGLPHLSALFPA